MKKKGTPPPEKPKEAPTSGAEFDALVKEVLANPEKIKDKSITGEQVLALQRRLNPYAYVPKVSDTDKKKVAVVSYTNLRADYLKRFTMTSLVGFIFRMFDEWSVPAEVRSWTPKRKKKKKKKNPSAVADDWSPDDLLERIEGIRSLALIAKKAKAESDEAKARAETADQAHLEAAAVGEDVKEKKAEADKSLKVAFAALGKYRGLQLAAMAGLRKMGKEVELQIGNAAELARLHPEIREIVDRDPTLREDSGEGGRGRIEAPEKVAKKIISNFLRTWFEYNPDAHVRSAYDEFVVQQDTDKFEVPGLGEVKIDRSDPARLPLEVVRAKPPAFATEGDKEVFDQLTLTPEAYNAAAFFLRNDSAALALLQALGEPEKFRRYLYPARKAREAFEIIPPQDTFHRWSYYEEVNYEELRVATEAVYHEKPDLDMALVLYDHYEGTDEEVNEAFETFRDAHEEEIPTDIKSIDFGQWILLGDFKENRSKIEFYNKNTGLLKRILDRHAEDKKLGKDLMRKRVRNLKAKNIKEAGPDDPGLATYREGLAEAGKDVGALGAEKVISREEMFRLERAKGDKRAAQELEVLDQCRATIRELGESAKVRKLLPEEETRLKDAQKDLRAAQEMIEVPDDAIQVDVWHHNAAEGKMEKTKFYTEAEAPEHLRELQKEQLAAARANGVPARDVVAASDLAPFAQHQLAREVAASELEKAKNNPSIAPPALTRAVSAVTQQPPK